MAGAIPVVGSSVVDSHSSPCLCSGDLFSQRNSAIARKYLLRRPGSFIVSGHNSRLFAKANKNNSKKHLNGRGLVVVNELAGQYEDSFEDVKNQILNYFTYKAVKTVLSQLYEMNPTTYRWFYDFVATHNPGEGKRFIRVLVKEKQDLAERVMVTRLHLYGRWIKKCDHAAMYKEISDQNLALMRERLMETVIWPSDDTNMEKIG